MDTIIFILLLVTAIIAYRGENSKHVMPLYGLVFLMTAWLFHHHVTSALPLQF